MLRYAVSLKSAWHQILSSPPQQAEADKAELKLKLEAEVAKGVATKAELELKLSEAANAGSY